MIRISPTAAALLLILFLSLGADPASGQSQPQPQPHLALPGQPVGEGQTYPLRQTPFYVEVDLLLNPVYIAQFSSKFRLNGQDINIPKSYRPHFYGTQPFQNPFSSLEEIADQSNAAYASIYMPFLEKSKIPFFHHIRFVIGATHDKMKSDSSSVVEYEFYDGGTELTLLLEKNITYGLSTRQYQSSGIIFGINVQTGVFGVVAKPRTNINFNGYQIKSINTDRYQWPSARNGWGWITGMNMEIGGLICHDYIFSKDFSQNCWLGKGLFWFFRRVGVSVSSKLMIEGLYSADGVTANIPGDRLRVNNYSLFFAGPLINLKWITLNVGR